MRRSALLLLKLLAAFAIVPSAAWSQQREPRLALMIGNASYPDAATPLTSTADSRTLAEEFGRNGFVVDRRENLGKADMRAAIDSFVAKIGPGSIALFYFSGYGLQIAKQNYLIPVSAQIWKEGDVPLEGTSIDELLGEMHRKGGAIKIVIIDAARRNPYERRVRRVPVGLAAVSIPDNVLIMYSAAPDKLISDDGTAESLFTKELVKDLRGPKARAEEVFNRVRIGVYEASHAQQNPWISSSLVTQFDLGSSPAAVSPGPATPAPGSTSAPAEPAAAAQAVTAPAATPPAPGSPIIASAPAIADAPLSQEREAALKPKDSFKECAACPEMVVIPAGEFVMGSPDDEPERYPTEGPQHSVKIGRPLAVGKFKITRDEFDAFVRETNYSSDKCFTIEDGKVEERLGRSFRNPGFAQEGRHPAVCVNWDDAKAYVGWLTRKTGKAYRLLTESEWEYAARAGTTTAFWWGTSISTEQANYDGTSTYAGGAKGEYRQKTVPVDSFTPNTWGLYQVHGNAFEWVEDCWNEGYQNAPADDAASLTGNCSRHVRRGGAWNFIPATLRSAYRDSRPAITRGSNTGLRVARTLNQTQQ
jgi:formylglycine-generating enzyme required for sulfatase activity